MTATGQEGSLARGYGALAAGDWEAARDAFEEAVDGFDSPDALDGLGRALWWLRDERGAVVQGHPRDGPKHRRRVRGDLPGRRRE